ncbi:MAG: GIY-YIG nuclease family protein [Planctomycetota bacterium]
MGISKFVIPTGALRSGAKQCGAEEPISIAPALLNQGVNENLLHLHLGQQKRHALYGYYIQSVLPGQRTQNHKLPGFTDKYNVNRLLYYEKYGTPAEAIKREKQIKSWRREKKINLIDSENPDWNDLAENWYDSYIRVTK